MEGQRSIRRGELLNYPHWPKYVGALALNAWLTRVAEYDDVEPSVELYIAQYPTEEAEQAHLASEESTGQQLFEVRPVQLPLHLQWGGQAVPDSFCEIPLTPNDDEHPRNDLIRPELAAVHEIEVGRQLSPHGRQPKHTSN